MLTEKGVFYNNIQIQRNNNKREAFHIVRGSREADTSLSALKNLSHEDEPLNKPNKVGVQKWNVETQIEIRLNLKKNEKERKKNTKSHRNFVELFVMLDVNAYDTRGSSGQPEWQKQ